MQAELVKTFWFQAAHALPNVPAGHKCGRIHGHNYRVDIHVTGPVVEPCGWVMDYGDIKAIVEPVLAELDHRNLNEVEGLANSTSELIAQWLWRRISPVLPGLSAITIWESDSSRCVFRG